MIKPAPEPAVHRPYRTVPIGIAMSFQQTFGRLESADSPHIALDLIFELARAPTAVADKKSDFAFGRIAGVDILTHTVEITADIHSRTDFLRLRDYVAECVHEKQSVGADRAAAKHRCVMRTVNAVDQIRKTVSCDVVEHDTH